MESIALWCLVQGNRAPIQVIISASNDINDLKKSIKDDEALEGPTSGITVWKLNESITLKPTSGLSQRVLSQGRPIAAIATELEPSDDLSTVFPQKPREGDLHIYVTLETVTFSFEIIKDQIEAELASLQPTVEAFLNDPELPIWDPPENFAANIREFIKGLQIPTYRNGKPSLLFHKLHECDGEEITKIFEAETHMCICNTSGSGKTRRIMEGLTKYWGFYLVASPDVNGVGIRDLREALDLVANYRDWVSDLTGVSPENRAAQNNTNSQIASRVIHRVLAARILVFGLFLQVAKQVDGHLQEKHKRIWLLFQLFDFPSRRGGSLHPFLRIIDKLRLASDEALNICIGHLNSIIDTYIPKSRLILGLDEAQRAARLYPYSGLSSTNPKVFRSIICDMVKVFTKAPIKLVVSGTGLSLADLEEAMTSGVSKPAQAVEVFHALGMFDTWPKLKCFVERYIPPFILESHSGSSLQVRMQEYLLGRYRFSVSFLEFFLMNGLQSPHKLLNKYLEDHLTCPPGDTGDPFTSDEPIPFIDFKVQGFEWDKLQLDSSAIQEALTIVRSHVTKGRSPQYGPVTAKLVEYGIARLREGHKGHIIEPLAFLSVMRWLQTRTGTNLSADLRLQAGGDPESRGHALEGATVLYMIRRLRYPVRLSTIFNFHHGHRPPWANEEAQIVAQLKGASVSVDLIGDAPQNSALGVVNYAQTIDEIIHWIEGPGPAPVILISTILFGPDVLAKVKIPSSSTPIILMGQLKSYTDGNIESLDASTLSGALTSLHPSHWFKKTPEDQRQKLIDTIKKHDVLRFVAGCPLPPDLNLKAESVRTAISGFESGDALASIKSDDLRRHFKSEEALDVLEPMEVALTSKRKASEIS